MPSWFRSMVRPDRCRGGAGGGVVEVHVWPLEHAVAAHVGDEVPSAAVLLEHGEGLPQVAAIARCAAGGEPVPGRTVDMFGDTHVEGDRNPFTVGGDRPRTPCLVLQRGGAEDDPLTAGGQRLLEGSVVADAARQFDLDIELPDLLVVGRDWIGAGYSGRTDQPEPTLCPWDDQRDSSSNGTVIRRSSSTTTADGRRCCEGRTPSGSSSTSARATIRS